VIDFKVKNKDKRNSENFEFIWFLFLSEQSWLVTLSFFDQKMVCLNALLGVLFFLYKKINFVSH